MSAESNAPQPVMRERLHTPDILRGIASLAVMWFHFTRGNPDFLPDGVLKSSGRYGWAGVEAFFVISGFIIPYALYKGNYRLSDYGTFMAKRVLRLHPPYLVAIALVVLLNFLSGLAPGFKGEPFSLSWKQLLLHVGYLNVFTGSDWVVPAFWTLAIEFQYYLLIGLIFGVIVSKNSVVRWAALLILGTLSFVFTQQAFVMAYLLLFVLGILTFQRKIGLLNDSLFLPLILLATCGTYFCLGAAAAVVGFFSALFMAFVHIDNRVLKFFGDISYSLYLLHIPIGGRIINLSLRFKNQLENPLVALLVLALATAASIIAAYCLYRWVEKLSQRWSAALRYSHQTISILQPAMTTSL